MSVKRVKTSEKIFISDLKLLQKKAVEVTSRIADIVGSSFGPGGRNVLIESEVIDIPHKNTKDGVSIFRALGASNPIDHLIIEQTRDAAIRTVNEAGDGPQPLYSKVLTPSGFITMGEVAEGMDVCGTDGTIQKVLGVFPKGIKEIYKLTLSDGREVECCSDHLWEATTSYGSKKTITTGEMIKDFVNNSDGESRYKYYLPQTKVEFKDKELPLDPYLLGVLLGDGSLSNNGSIELSLGLNKKHILDKITLPLGATKKIELVEEKNSYRVKIKGIRGVIQALGISNTSSHTKFIPKEYLISSIKNRERLLQGLIDTDGHVNKRGLFEYSTVSNSLKDDFLTLTRSLGKSVHYRLQNRNVDTGSYSNTPVHRITELKGYKYGIKVVNIESTGKLTQMQCIKVSNPDNLYITDNFVVTHNTTTATIISAEIIKNLFAFCDANRKYSPQKATRLIKKHLQEIIVPFIDNASIKINNKNKGLLEKVATISANGDKEMSKAVIKAFEEVGYGASSHVTIQELSGPSGQYEVDLIEGFPIDKGYEESVGKFHAVFINDQAHQRCVLDKPLFLLFDGNITDLNQVKDIFEELGEAYASGESEHKNVVVVAHRFSEEVMNVLAHNFPNPHTINIVPLITPMNMLINSQLNFLLDLSAFTGATIFDMNNALHLATPEDLGSNMEKIEIYRFRTTLVGEPDSANIETRAEEIRGQVKNSGSKIEKAILEERLGRLTSGIAQLKIYGASNGELKERADRAEDAVCAVRAAINHGCIPGGCRVLLNLIAKLTQENSDDKVVTDVIIPSLFLPFYKLLENAGYSEDEVQEIANKLFSDKDLVYDVENGEYGNFKDMGVFDATLSLKQALINAVSIASVMGTLGGLVVSPRDNQLEIQNSRDLHNFNRTLENADNIKNEANERA